MEHRAEPVELPAHSAIPCPTMSRPRDVPPVIRSQCSAQYLRNHTLKRAGVGARSAGTPPADPVVAVGLRPVGADRPVPAAGEDVDQLVLDQAVAHVGAVGHGGSAAERGQAKPISSRQPPAGRLDRRLVGPRMAAAGVGPQAAGMVFGDMPLLQQQTAERGRGRSRTGRDAAEPSRWTSSLGAVPTSRSSASTSTTVLDPIVHSRHLVSAPLPRLSRPARWPIRGRWATGGSRSWLSPPSGAAGYCRTAPGRRTCASSCWRPPTPSWPTASTCTTKRGGSREACAT